jgi:hypothetical protein
MSLIKTVKNLILPGREDITFKVDPVAAMHLPAPPQNIAFAEPYDSSFAHRRDGYYSLGPVPNADELEKKRFKLRPEFQEVKTVGSTVFKVPYHRRALIPMVQLTASFEQAHNPHFLNSSAVLLVRDYSFFEAQAAQEIHHDPDYPEAGMVQHVYSFASCHPTVFPGHRTPGNYEITVFTPSAPHGRPAMDEGQNILNSLRRLFVGVAYIYRPSERHLHVIRENEEGQMADTRRIKERELAV